MGWKCFFYNSTTELQQAQQHLIELGFHCIETADFIDYQLRCYIYNILTLVFLRGEFCLTNLRFTKKNSGCMEYLIKR